jgi:hypothetical protein
MMVGCSVLKFVRTRLEGASAADLVKSMQAKAQKEKSYEEHRDLAQVVRAQRMARDWTRQHFPRLPIPLQVESLLTSHSQRVTTLLWRQRLISGESS